MADAELHKNHRKRELEMFRQRGGEGLPDHKVLELLLFFSRPRGDVNELAHTLIDHFGSLKNVFNASYEQLMAVNGVGEHTATLLTLVLTVSNRYHQERIKPKQSLKTHGDFQRYLAPYFYGACNEKAYVLCLDSRFCPLLCKQLSEQAPTSSSIALRTVTSLALGCNAAEVVLAHNHPTGIAKPSMEDIAATRAIIAGLENVGVQLYDHFIFADDRMISMREGKYL